MLLVHAYVINTLGSWISSKNKWIALLILPYLPLPLQFEIWSVSYIWQTTTRSHEVKINSGIGGFEWVDFCVTQETLVYVSSLDLALLHRQSSLKWSWSSDPLIHSDTRTTTVCDTFIPTPIPEDFTWASIVLS